MTQLVTQLNLRETEQTCFAAKSVKVFIVGLVAIPTGRAAHTIDGVLSIDNVTNVGHPCTCLYVV